MKTKINYIKGDLIELALSNEYPFDLVIHGCNCFCVMGAGIAKTIKEKFPEAFAIDVVTKTGDPTKLGTISYSVPPDSEKRPIVVNAYTQYGHDPSTKPFNYGAFRSCCKLIMEDFKPGCRIGMPMIGTGLAGGEWELIEKIMIDEQLDTEYNITVVEYEPKI